MIERQPQPPSVDTAAAPDLHGLAGRRALVSGGTQGIGRACAHELARRGAQVTIVARDRATLERTARELPADAGQRHAWIALDLSDTAAVEIEIRSWIDRYGTLEILLNNAAGPPPGPVLTATTDAFLQSLRLHLLASHTIVQALVPGMKANNYGRIINIISTSVREPIANLGVSNTTRGAMASWAKTLAMELAPFAITVNNILPGYTETGRLRSLIENTATRRGVSSEQVSEEMRAKIPLGRFANPAEIANVVGFLASPAASYVTGVSLPVDGGRIASI